MSQPPSPFDPALAGVSDERAPVRRPLVGLLLMVVAALVFSEAVSCAVGSWIIAAWVALLFSFVPTLRSARTLLLYALAFSLVAGYAEHIRRPVSPSHLANRMERPIENLELSGVVVGDPILEEGRRPDRVSWRFPFRVERVKRETRWQDASGQVDIRLETAGTFSNIVYGERWTLHGPVRKSAGRFAQPPRLSLSIKEDAVQRLPGQGGWFLRRWCLQARHWCADQLGAGIESDAAAVGLARALTLGYRQEITPRAQLAFSRTGTMHVVAISGAHVGVVALLLLTLVRATGLSQPRWPWVMTPLLVLYALGTGMSPSAVRACLMAICFYFAYSCWRQPDALSSLSLSALIILGVDPSQLARPGFLLSYTVVAGLITLFPRVRVALHRRFVPAPGIKTWWSEHVVVPARRSFLDLVGVTGVAWLVSTPLVLYFFNLVSPVGLFANLVVVPLAFLILFASCLALLLGFIHPALLEAFNHAGRLFSSWLFAVVDLCDRIPGGAFYSLAPPIWLLGLFLLLVWMGIAGGRIARRVALIAAVITLSIVVWRVGPGRPFEVAVRHLGAAPVAVLHVPRSGDWLIDTGPAFTAKRVVKFLNERGVNNLRGVIFTRASTDAASALPAILEHREVQDVWIPAGRIRSRPFADAVLALEQSGIRVTRRAHGDRIPLPGGVCEVLSPDPTLSYPDSASGGLVLRFSHWASAFVVFPTRASRLEASLLALPQDYGGQAAVELSAARDRETPDPDWDFAFRPDVVIRPMDVGESFRPDDALDLRSGLVRLAIDETAILRAVPQGGFRVEAPASRDDEE